jgi:hypothetical protein
MCVSGLSGRARPFVVAGALGAVRPTNQDRDQVPDPPQNIGLERYGNLRPAEAKKRVRDDRVETKPNGKDGLLSKGMMPGIPRLPGTVGFTFRPAAEAARLASTVSSAGPPPGMVRCY